MVSHWRLPFLMVGWGLLKDNPKALSTLAAKIFSAFCSPGCSPVFKCLEKECKALFMTFNLAQ